MKIWGIRLGIAVLAAVSLFVGAGHASALSSNPKVFISGDNTFFAYVRAGEKVSANFTKANHNEPLGWPGEDITVTLDGPDALQQKCVLAKDIAVGRGCAFAETVAPKTGIWRIQFALPSTARLYPQVSPTVRWNGSMFSWNIRVADGTGEKPGRVWSELYAIRQPNDAEFAADLLYYYVSEDGYLYRATYKGYHGQISTLSADAFGIRRGTGCTSAYQSISVDDTAMSPSFGQCGGSYKLFFEQPAGELPENAERWDGTKDWVRPGISRPIVEGLKFEPDDSQNQQSGKISFSLKNFVGQYEIKIDTNNDGNYDASEDVKITRRIQKLTDTAQEVVFRGIDGDDQPIPREQRIGIKINIARLAEIHLVNADVEGRAGGLEIMRLNGDNAPRGNMCWNDTSLPDTILPTEEKDGRACPVSTGGAHGWGYGTGSWGDMRYIDDWAYAAARVDGTAEIFFPGEEEEAAAVQSRRDLGMIIAGVTGGVAIVGALVGAIIYRRHHRRPLPLLPQSSQPDDRPPQAPLQ